MTPSSTCAKVGRTTQKQNIIPASIYALLHLRATSMSKEHPIDLDDDDCEFLPTLEQVEDDVMKSLEMLSHVKPEPKGDGDLPTASYSHLEDKDGDVIIVDAEQASIPVAPSSNTQDASVINTYSTPVVPSGDATHTSAIPPPSRASDPPHVSEQATPRRSSSGGFSDAMIISLSSAQMFR
eukprot:TRINITY_DN18843_c0_g1_i1.p1 TRINITY_DN18843_c0_g1~~TRINITY_DN18843_c0_g1_i1.p1  ORF type:complete len:181 (+),score=28.43 TRINITY_DN18843_c0_g1_i1:1-543(+)